MASLLLGRHPGRTLVRVAVLVAAAILVFGWVLLPVRAEGISMRPTYEPGGFRLVNRLAYRIGNPRRGDVVAIRLAGEGVIYIKRVLGLPGERLHIEGGRVIVDGTPVEEPYVRHRRDSWTLPEATLGADEYFVAGDNRGMPIEQHELGKVRRGRIAGKVVW